MLFVLRDRPEQAEWLEPEERTWLVSELERDRARYGATQHHAFTDAFRMPILWLLVFVYVSVQIGVYVVNLWMPLMLSSLSTDTSHDSSTIAGLSTLPYLLAAVFTVVDGWSSDR